MEIVDNECNSSINSDLCSNPGSFLQFILDENIQYFYQPKLFSFSMFGHIYVRLINTQNFVVCDFVPGTAGWHIYLLYLAHFGHFHGPWSSTWHISNRARHLLPSYLRIYFCNNYRRVPKVRVYVSKGLVSFMRNKC